MQVAITDGVAVDIPDSLESITPYVLREQGDWFEDEIHFVRLVLSPSATVLDIGANYGVYALSAAKRVGPGGRVIAFEPASPTAVHLRRSIEANGYQNVTVVQAALSDRVGVAQFTLSPHAELNRLVGAATSARSREEEVPLTTLDHIMRELQLSQVDFVKLDAEGEEINILKGGREFFRRLAPLAMYEIKIGNRHNHDLMRSFEEMGFQNYRLVPGLNVLAPAEQFHDPYQLNLFACTPERAVQLHAQGWLVRDTVPVAPCSWNAALTAMPNGESILKLGRIGGRQPEWAEYERCLESYFSAHAAGRTAAQRFSALADAYQRAVTLCRQAPNLSRWSTLARISIEFGARSEAVRAISSALSGIHGRNGAVQLPEPFLPVGELPGEGKKLQQRFHASLIERLEVLRHYSSYYTGTSALEAVAKLAELGVESAPMSRRGDLIRARFRL